MRKNRLKFLIIFLIITVNIVGFTSQLGQPTHHRKFGNEILPIAQDYETNSSETVNVVTAFIEQGYKNDTDINLDQDTTSFSVPAPNATGYDSSYIKISVKDLTAENHTLIVEDNSVPSGFHDVNNAQPSVTSFTIPTDCYLTNLTFNVRRTLAQDGNMTVRLYNSSWSGTINEPNSNVNQYIQIGNLTTGNGWKSITNINLFLNNSNTDNNTWYVGFVDHNTAEYNGNWWYTNDDSSGDNNDETLSYEYLGASTWGLVEDTFSPGVLIDFHLQVGLSLNDSTPNPKLLDLHINGTSVDDNLITPSANNGTWININPLHGADNFLDFTVIANWYTYSLNIDQTIVNYTNSFDAVTTYTAESGVNVFWNATTEINQFDHRLINNTVIFTIPNNWNTPLSRLDRDSTEISPYSTASNGTAKFITVRGSNAIDGNWTLLTTSSNLLIEIGINSPVIYVNETVEFNATFSTPVSGIVNISVYNPQSYNDEMVFSSEDTITDASFIDLTDWDVDVDSLISIDEYGPYRVQVRWDNDTDMGIIDSTVVIAANTSYTILTTPQEILSNQGPFNISIQYFDEFKSQNVTGATIGFENATSNWNSEVQNNPMEEYNITINPADYSSGIHLIPITLNKTYYMNHTFTYEITFVESMQVFKNYGSSNLNVARGENATFVLNYNTTAGEIGIQDAIINDVSINSYLVWSYNDLSSGNYEIVLNTSEVNADFSPFNCVFNISLINATNGYQTLQFDFDIAVTVAQTSMSLNSQTDVIARNSGNNATIYFHVTDTTNGLDLTGIPESDFYVYNESTSLIWDVGTFDWKVTELTGGDYVANISLNGLNYGTQTVRLNVSYAPNYNYSILVTSFYIRGNFTEITIKEFNNNAGNILPTVNSSKQFYLDGTHVGLILNLNDTENANQYVTDDEGNFKYWARFNGTQPLVTSFIYDRNNDVNIGSIALPTGLTAGQGNITLIIGQKNYENATIKFNITFLEPLSISISQIVLPSVLIQNNQTVIRFRVTYMNGTLQPLANAYITISSNNTDFISFSNYTDGNGYVEFTVSAPEGRYDAITFYISYNGVAYGISGGTASFIVPVERARTWSEWILYGVLLVVGLSLAVVAVQQGIVKPRKKKYRELLYNTVAVFEDAINLQHVLIMHKNTGTCVFFKTFGILDIDPDLISGFLSAAQSFVRESMSADGISEIKSGDNHLLISDGELVRVTLVLAKGASQFLRANTARLVMLFENQYYQELIDWKGSLNVFQDAGPLIDDTLHTSVILPHQITTSIKILKSVKSPLAQKLLKIARELTTAQRSFFFIAQLVAESKEKLNKKPPEILLALNELLDAEAISPVDLSGYDEQPISEQEMNLLAQRVMQLPDLTNPEREALVKDLVRMNAAEREAALTSIQQGQKITSDVSHRMITTKMFTSKKDAKAEINRLVKEAQKMVKQRRFGDAVLCFETASVTAGNWKMPEDSKKLRDKALNAQIAAFNDKIRKGQKEVPRLIRQGEDERALNYCEEAYEAASSLFKLGFTEYEKTVKKFGSMLQEVRKNLKNYDTTAEGVFKDDKKHFEKMERDLLKKAQKLEKEKNYHEAVSAYSELTVIANKIFKFGVLGAKDKIKKYKSMTARLKKKAMKAVEEGKSILNEEELLDQKSQLLNLALEAEQAQDYLRSIYAYEEVIKIHHKLGDSEGATKLEDKIHSIVSNIPNVERVLSDMLYRANTHFEQGSYDLAFNEYQYSLGIAKALNMQDRVIEISAKLDEISRRI